MNVHHLELFYYVAKHEGIVAACRHMPYGIQQPAVSAQVARLEADLGTRLFERRPFRLTASGRALQDFISPFFSRLGEIEDLIKGRLALELKLAGLTEVMRGHLPFLLAGLRKKHPGLRLTLHEIDQAGAEQLIARGEADLAVTVLETKLPSGFRSLKLLELPVCLLIREDMPYQRAADLLKAGAGGRVPLISLPAHERLPRLFQKEMAVRRRVWKTSIETSSQDLVAIYVRNGLGAGLAVRTPELEKDKDLRMLPLSGFPKLPIGVFWRGELGEVQKQLVTELVKRSKEIFAS